MLKEKYDLFFIYYPSPAGCSTEITSEAGAAILGYELEIYVAKGRAKILWSRNTDYCGTPIPAWSTKHFKPLLFYVFFYNNWTIF